jgi:hypothetical protein
MIVKNVPFFPNTPDDTHCLQAVLKMILKYFEPKKDYSFEELDLLSDKVLGKWTWATRALVNLEKMGYKLANMEDFDYHNFSQNGKKYLIKKFGNKVAHQQMVHSDIEKEMVDAKEFIEIFGNNFVIPEIKDIKYFIDSGYLVGCNINANVLNKEPGYCGHFILIFGYDDQNLHIHDPGAPPISGRKVTWPDFLSAWAYPGHDNQNLTAFKYQK